MTKAQTLHLVLLSVTLGMVSYAQAADNTRYNPFQRHTTVQATTSNSTSASEVRSFRINHPRLRAVLQATDGSLANLDGHVLAQGESALGYTLVAVQDHSAKFKFRQHIITLQVTEDSP